MIQINLLPWREELRNLHKQQFVFELGIAGLLAVILTVGIHAVISSKISAQNQRGQFIQTHITELHNQIKTYKALDDQMQQLINNLHLVRDMQNSRFKIVGFLDEVVRLIPKKVHLNRIDQKGNKVVIEGTATSNNKITRFMKNIERSKWLTAPVLNEIKVDDDDFHKRHFELVTLQRDSKILTVDAKKEVK